jgi:hypothetical protein
MGRLRTSDAAAKARYLSGSTLEGVVFSAFGREVGKHEFSNTIQFH